MQPHHEAAAMTHVTELPKYDEKEVSKVTAQEYPNEKADSDIEKSELAATTTLAPFDKVYRYFVTVTGIIGVVLFINLIRCNPLSQDWVTVNYHLALKALVAAVFHTVACVRRYVVGRVKGMSPWGLELIYVVAQLGCCGLHYYCAWWTSNDLSGITTGDSLNA